MPELRFPNFRICDFGPQEYSHADIDFLIRIVLPLVSDSYLAHKSKEMKTILLCRK